MAILAFIRRASGNDRAFILLLTLLAGLANGLLVVIVNQVASHVAQGERPDWPVWLCFAAAFLFYYQGNSFALLRANRVIERLLKQLRIGLIDRLRASELPAVDKIGRGHLYTLVSQETNFLSATFPLLVDCFQQAVLLLVALAYLFHLSTAAFLVFLAAVALGLLAYRSINDRFGRTLALVGECQARILDAIADIIHGAKELRLNQRRSDAVLQSYRQLSRENEAMLIQAGEHWEALILLGSMVVFGMLGVVGFTFPQYIEGHGTVVFELVPVLMFCIGPFSKIVSQSPMFIRAEAGLKGVLAIETQLAAAGSASPAEARSLAIYAGFSHIRYAGLTMKHLAPDGTPSFTLGPLNLDIRRGETVFLVGGNGSGKSTSLKLMTGLRPADAGEILVDDRPLSARDIAGLRELFSAIFVDFHLFDRLYGLEHVPPAEVEALIEEMGLSDKLRYRDGSFSTTHLSTGQRKRLALIAALLEDRPIYVFDEWSAEQDVQFRAYFYEILLARLKARGKTVIAVTHDERYWHLADRVVKLDLGQVEWEKPGSALKPQKSE